MEIELVAARGAEVRLVTSAYLRNLQGSQLICAGMDERGSALVFVLLTMVLGTVGLALLSLARQERLMAQYQYRQTQAFYLAEAGLQWAEARLVQSPLTGAPLS